MRVRRGPELLLAEHLLTPAQGQLLLIFLLTAGACRTGMELNDISETCKKVQSIEAPEAGERECRGKAGHNWSDTNSKFQI